MPEALDMRCGFFWHHLTWICHALIAVGPTVWGLTDWGPIVFWGLQSRDADFGSRHKLIALGPTV